MGAMSEWVLRFDGDEGQGKAVVGGITDKEARAMLAFLDKLRRATEHEEQRLIRLKHTLRPDDPTMSAEPLDIEDARWLLDQVTELRNAWIEAREIAERSVKARQDAERTHRELNENIHAITSAMDWHRQRADQRTEQCERLEAQLKECRENSKPAGD
jgi:hypothetical protein